MVATQDRFDFRIKWLPFFLDPSLPKEGVDKLHRYRSKFGSNIEPMLSRMKKVGEQEGINFSYGGKIANTMNAHRLAAYADKFGKEEQVINVLFKNYFEEEKDLGSLDVLTEAAKNAGMDEQKTRKFLESKELEEEVTEAVEKSLDEYGVTGVPFFIIQNKYAVSGAQESDTFQSIFQKVAEEEEGRKGKDE